MQHVELVDRELREGAARSAVLVPAPGARCQLERPFVGEVRFHERNASQLPGLDLVLDDAYAGHQACAVAHGDGDPVLLLQRGDPQPVLERLRDWLLGIDVLLRLGHFLSQREMLLIGHGQDDTLDVGIGKQRLHIGRGRNAQLLLERGALLFRAAVAADDLELVGFLHGAGEDLGPAAQADDAELDGLRHASVLLMRVAAGRGIIVARALESRFRPAARRGRFFEDTGAP